MSYFDKWKVKTDYKEEKIEKKDPKKEIPRTLKITTFLEKSPIKIIEIPDEKPEPVDYSGPVIIEKEIPKLLPQKTAELSSFLDMPQSETIYVYTDGSCIFNGKPNARAGYGIYFGPNDPRNTSKKVVGKQTNNTGELTAIIEAIRMLQWEINNGKKVVIYTDSEYCIKCFTTYGRRLEMKGFKSDKPIPNLELLKTGLSLMKPNINLRHIRSHTGKQDEHSFGNEMADKLANQAIGVEPKVSQERRVYLETTYADRDKAKAMGARFDFEKKKWYLIESS